MKSILKLIAVLAIALTSLPASASHLIGGDIQYEYLGTSGGNHRFKVRLVLYREQSGITLGATQTVQVTSSNCGTSYSVQVQRIQPEFPATTAFDCISTQNSAFTPMVNIYESTVSSPLLLPASASCSDYLLYWSTCCRPGGITNIVNSASQGFYFEAELNLRTGLAPNSSPFFQSEPVAYYCTGTAISYLQQAAEPDGDSLRYTLIDPREGPGQLVPYTAGFSFQNPFTTTPGNPYRIDAKTGLIEFTADPSAAGQSSTMAIRVEEYRFDSTYFIWEKVGSSNREIQVVIASSCVAAVNAGVRLDPQAPGVTIDAQGRQTKEYNCLDSSVTMHFTIGVECNTVSVDGTDFRLTAPNGQPIPVKSIQTYCDNNGETDSITLKLYKPLIFNGDYFLYSKVGNDGNTLVNRCGKPMAEFDTIILKVTNCLDPKFGVTGVTVDEDRRNRIDYVVDTTTIPAEFLDFVRIFRSDDSSKTYFQINTGNPTLGYIYDAAPGPNGVDRQYYYYGIELVANGQELGRSKGLHTINLEGDASDANAIPLTWSNYGGPSYSDFGNTEFHLQWGKKLDTTYDWQYVATNDFPMGDSVYTLVPPSTASGQYAIRILTDPDPDGYVSESNWVTYSIGTPPPPPVIEASPIDIPNVFSPNGDGLNDQWTIENIGTWHTRPVSIFNRWGTVVWSTNQYDNNRPFEGKDNQGNDLPDGTYFYVIETIHPSTDSHETHEGALTIVRGAN